MFGPVLGTVYKSESMPVIEKHKISGKDKHKKINRLQCAGDQRARWRHVDTPVGAVFPLTRDLLLSAARMLSS